MSNRRGLGPHASRRGLLQAGLAIGSWHWASALRWGSPAALTSGTTPYTVTGRFNGRFANEIVVIGSNRTEVVHVEEVPFTTEEELMKELSAA